MAKLIKGTLLTKQLSALVCGAASTDENSDGSSATVAKPPVARTRSGGNGNGDLPPKKIG